jgi:hypothetical protein
MINLPSVRHLCYLTAPYDYGYFGQGCRGQSRDAINTRRKHQGARMGVLQVTLVGH